MSDKIDKNNKQIAASQKRIDNLNNQESTKDAQLEQLKKEIANLKKEKQDIRRKQNAEKRKNRNSAMFTFAGDVLKLFPNLHKAEKEIYTLGEYQELYNTILTKIKDSNIDFAITPPDDETLVGNKDQIVIPTNSSLKAVTVSSDQKALLIRAWEFLKNLFSENSTKYSTQQINERIMYYVESENPSTIIDDYQAMQTEETQTIDVLMSLH